MKKRAVRRLIVALILIGAAIVGLTLVDRLTVVDRPKPRPLPSIAVAPPPSEPAQPTPPTPPAGETDVGSAAPEESGKPPTPEVSQVPDAHKEAKPTLPPPAAGVAPATPASPGRAPSQANLPQSPGGGAPSVPPSSGAPAPARGGSSAPTAAGAASRPPVAAAPAPMLKLEEDPKTPDRGYTVQMGVFNTYNNADALLAKLKERGVPAYTETRVLVGPFRSRQEARRAAQTLKELGAGRVIPPPER